MTNRVQCKYFASGACTRGDSCHFAHTWTAPATNICKFYLQGTCAYGANCRYEHSRPAYAAPAGPERTAPVFEHLPRPQAQPPPPDPSAVRRRQGGGGAGGGAAAAGGAWARVAAGPEEPSLDLFGMREVEDELGLIAGSDDDYDFLPAPDAAQVQRGPPAAGNADRPICSLAAKGWCSRGAACKFIHGDLCPHCGHAALHPHRAEEREEHLQACAAAEARRADLESSADVECCICLEKVLSKARTQDRRFGILPGCEHAFCLACIRGWRRAGDSAAQEDNVRSCPICRTLSHYVVPSTVWVTDPEKKRSVTEAYKQKMMTIPCRLFDYGEGNCPFGSSCFYAHKNRDGTSQKAPSLRRAGNAEGGVEVMRPVMLADFLNIQPVSARRRR